MLTLIEHRLFLQGGSLSYRQESRPHLAPIWKLQPRENGILLCLTSRSISSLVLTDVMADLILSGEILCSMLEINLKVNSPI